MQIILRILHTISTTTTTTTNPLFDRPILQSLTKFGQFPKSPKEEALGLLEQDLFYKLDALPVT